MANKINSILPESAGNLLAVEIGDHMNVADYKNIFESAAERIFSQYDEGRLVLKYTRPFLGWELEAAELDLSLLARKGKHLSKIALVDPPEIVMPKWRTLKPILQGDLRIFEEGQYQEAVTWALA